MEKQSAFRAASELYRMMGELGGMGILPNQPASDINDKRLYNRGDDIALALLSSSVVDELMWAPERGTL